MLKLIKFKTLQFNTKLDISITSLYNQNNMNKLFEQSKKPELLYFKEDSSDDGDDSSM